MAHLMWRASKPEFAFSAFASASAPLRSIALPLSSRRVSVVFICRKPVFGNA